MIRFFTEMFQDETGSFSSKRFVGVIAGLTLCATLYANSFTSAEIKPADSLVDAVAMLSFGCLGLASVDKIWAKRDTNTTSSGPEKVVKKIIDEVKEQE
jgi:hypothetical protein